MAVPPEFIEDLRQRVPLSEIIGKRVKLVRKGRRFSGLCPFHSEKTPSFSVVDDDGYYHCFGCGVHGDAISFLREMDGLEFMEAVERLADMAGMAMPLGAPQDPKVTQQRKAALDILETTATFFRAALDREDGQDAARYLLNRNLDTNILQTYRLGYAPRGGLRAALSAKGFSDADMLAAGVLRKSDRDGSLYDYFRDRVMFPIENRQGKVIAFGARALGDAQPKYLNSGEGPTFSKKAVLYGWVQAREGLRRHLPLVIAEGYMDVIAIHKSGVAAAVAPLGTALTPEQIVLVWKLNNEPVLCFDGDAAGQKAQMRALERFLPLLEPGKTARFASLPAGKDPDDVLREAGQEGFKNIVATARSLVDTMWDGTMAEHDVRQPEQRAQFWQAIRSQIRNIGNNQVRSAFSDEIENRIAAMRTQMRGGTMPIAARTARRPSTGMINRHKALLALLLAHPALISGAFETLSMIDSGDERLEMIKKAAIDALISDPDLDAEALTYHLKGLNFIDELADLTGDDMKARLPFDPASLNIDAAEAHLGELVALINGKSGVFSKANQQRN